MPIAHCYPEPMNNEPCDDFAIIIPAYNEEKTILDVITPLLKYSKYIIVVADGCTDNTIQLIQDLPITILQNTKNSGKGAALQKGFAFIKEHSLNGAVTIDADGQHHPQDIDQIINGMKQHPNAIIIGARQGKRPLCPKYRYWANKTADFLFSMLLHKKIEDCQSGFRFYPSCFIEQDLSSKYQRFGYESHLLLLSQTTDTPIHCKKIQAIYPKNNRKSYYSPILDTLAILSIILTHIIKIIPARLKNILFVRRNVQKG